MKIRVPLFDLDYGPAEEEAVLAVMRSRWLTMGDRTAAFEREFAAFMGSGHAVGVANGTAALHLAMRVLGIGPGDEVIVPDLTFVATANAVLYEGGTPVLCDIVGPHDLTLDPADVEARVTDRTRAVIVMHYGGYTCDMDAIDALARSHGLAVVEDAAHAPGARYGGRMVGTLGDVGCFSFFSNKNLATGEGGMLTTSDADVAARVRLLRSHAMTAQTLDRHKGHARGYDVVELGYNYRLTEIEAALGSVQLAKLESENARRARHVAHYQELLSAIPGLDVPFGEDFAASRPTGSRSAFHIMTVLLPEGSDVGEVVGRLADNGIQSSVHYRPLHTFSSSSLAAARSDGLERVEGVAGRLLTLPLYPGMAEDDVDLVVDELRAALESVR